MKSRKSTSGSIPESARQLAGSELAELFAGLGLAVPPLSNRITYGVNSAIVAYVRGRRRQRQFANAGNHKRRKDRARKIIKAQRALRELLVEDDRRDPGGEYGDFGTLDDIEVITAPQRLLPLLDLSDARYAAIVADNTWQARFERQDGQTDAPGRNFVLALAMVFHEVTGEPIRTVTAVEELHDRVKGRFISFVLEVIRACNLPELSPGAIYGKFREIRNLLPKSAYIERSVEAGDHSILARAGTMGVGAITDNEVIHATARNHRRND